MKQKTHDVAGPGAEKPDTSGDGLIKDLAAKAAALAPALQTEKTGDPRRRGEITVDREIGNDDRYCLYIDDIMWAEIDFAYDEKKWCIQDCMGECLTHFEHVHAKSDGDRLPDKWPSGAETAIEKAKQMIRDGSMPSPEDARAAFLKREESKEGK